MKNKQIQTIKIIETANFDNEDFCKMEILDRVALKNNTILCARAALYRYLTFKN